MSEVEYVVGPAQVDCPEKCDIPEGFTVQVSDDHLSFGFPCPNACGKCIRPMPQRGDQ